MAMLLLSSFDPGHLYCWLSNPRWQTPAAAADARNEPRRFRTRAVPVLDCHCRPRPAEPLF